VGKGKGVADLKIAELMKRLGGGTVKEIILATNPTVDGETTALYLAKIIEPLNISVTRIAYGLPMGGNLDYTDSLTISKAIEGRRKI
jgi:recombination protein RecR